MDFQDISLHNSNHPFDLAFMKKPRVFGFKNKENYTFKQKPGIALHPGPVSRALRPL